MKFPEEKSKQPASASKQQKQEQVEQQETTPPLDKKLYHKHLIYGGNCIGHQLYTLAYERATSGFFYAEMCCHHPISQTTSEWITWAQDTALTLGLRENTGVRTLFKTIRDHLEYYRIECGDHPESHYPESSLCNSKCQVSLELRWKCCCWLMGDEECRGCDDEEETRKRAA